MNKKSAGIDTGSRVAVVGGGPAGSFFALYLLHYARQKGITPEVTIFQRRSFDALGSKGCKGCAGILSLSMQKNLGELGLVIPEHIVMARVKQYAIHTPYTSITISNPSRRFDIISVYRGGGPRLSSYDQPVSFDGWLLDQARQQGARVEEKAVSRVSLQNGASIEAGGEVLQYDLVVLAAGINDTPVLIDSLDYQPPQSQIMAQDELHIDAEEARARLGNVAHAFVIPHSNLIFGSLVPKGPFVNVSVLSSGKRPTPVKEFLENDLVRTVLPGEYTSACGCRPRAAVGAASNYFADRFVAVGDAAVTRLYKDGIGSALLTARQAARTAVFHGVSRKDFERHYKPFCRNLSGDNRWGRYLFAANDRAKNSRLFLLAQHRLIGDERRRAFGSQPFTAAAWGMFTGSFSYRSIARMYLNPVSLTRFVNAVFWEGLGLLLHRGPAVRKSLYVGATKVLILGSGFGGTYVLRKLVPSLNRNENVETTMVSDENFFLFSPLLHEAAMGGIEAAHIAYPIRRLHYRDRFNFIQAEVTRIDLKSRRVMTTMGALDFDYLVMALGSVTDTTQVKSAGSNIFTLKTLHDSRLIRNHIISLFERASFETDQEKQKQLLTFVVAGAGYTGVQLVAEMRELIFGDLVRFYKSIDPANIRIVLVEANRKIVSDLHISLGAHVMNHLKRLGIEVKLRSRVTAVTPDSVQLSRREVVPTRTLIWVAGVVANPRIAEVEARKDRLGRVVVNEQMEVPGFPGVYAVGDCACFIDPKSGAPVPPRAHIAVRQAKAAAHNILADIRGRPKKRYRYSEAAELVSLGSSSAVLRFGRFQLHGFVAHLLWLMAYSYLVTGTYNRIRIMMDWLLGLFFGRDTTFLKPEAPIDKGDNPV
ncbi:MAG: FAD-dependent oxidoreductase [Chloroflexi bacterium]|nr:FAD-dependent oxidoreductase [Chloroflexota bacterium]